MKKKVSILILEDEKSATNQLKVELAKLEDLEVNVLAELETCRDTVKWLHENDLPELIFMDIQLADGLSLNLFNHVLIPCPIIFVTAYHKYAIEVFHLNTVDYLLKPIDSNRLSKALNLFFLNNEVFSQRRQFEQLQRVLTKLDKPQYRQGFLVHYQQKLLLIQTSEISYFDIDHRNVYINTRDGRRFSLDYSLEKLEKQLNPQAFFRANRQMLIAKSAIQDIETYGQGKLLINLTSPPGKKVIVSKEKVSFFKQWANA